MARLARATMSWRFPTAVPPRYVFAAFEQMCGTPPYRYEVTGPDRARIVEFERKGLVGNWTRRVGRARWVTVSTSVSGTGTLVSVEASGGLRRRRDRGAKSRALQIVELLSRGPQDRRSIYRDRTIPPGPVTLVASWAGTPYLLFAEPRFGAGRTVPIHTAMPLEAIGMRGAFVEVRLEDGRVGWVERDQLVAAPREATREAQVRTAVHG